MILGSLTPDQFAEMGKDWVEAISAVLNSVIAQFGILAAAALGVWKSISTKAELKQAKKELSARLDNQASRINDVAIAVAPANGKPINGHTTT